MCCCWMTQQITVSKHVGLGLFNCILFFAIVDLSCIHWLEEYICAHCDDCILIFVSHDRGFINNIATDIVEMKNLQLTYFPDTYDNYIIHKQEMVGLYWNNRNNCFSLCFRQAECKMLLMLELGRKPTFRILFKQLNLVGMTGL